VDADVDADALPCAVTAHEWHDVVAVPSYDVEAWAWQAAL